MLYNRLVMALVMMVMMVAHDWMIIMMFLVLVNNLMTIVVVISGDTNSSGANVNVLCRCSSWCQRQGRSGRECGKCQFHGVSPGSTCRTKRPEGGSDPKN
jgi:hypothetical protein